MLAIGDLTPNPSPKAEGDLTLTIYGSYFLATNLLFSSSFQRNIWTRFILWGVNRSGGFLESYHFKIWLLQQQIILMKMNNVYQLRQRRSLFVDNER